MNNYTVFSLEHLDPFLKINSIRYENGVVFFYHIKCTEQDMTILKLSFPQVKVFKNK
jgi:hypothetical protein